MLLVLQSYQDRNKLQSTCIRQSAKSTKGKFTLAFSTDGNISTDGKEKQAVKQASADSDAVVGLSVKAKVVHLDHVDSVFSWPMKDFESKKSKTPMKNPPKGQ